MNTPTQQFDPNQQPLNPVTLTPAACEHLKAQIKKRGAGIGLTFGVKPAGCTGYKYVVDIATEQSANTWVFSIDDDLDILVDKTSYPFVKGTVIDFQQVGLNSQFTYNNPNIKDECGCGESFNIDIDQDSHL